MQTRTYYGLASANGLESFLLNTYTFGRGQRFATMIAGGDQEKAEEMNKDYQTQLNGMFLAAQANAHRRTVVYEAEVPKEAAEIIEDMMKSGLNVEALNILKSSATKIGLLRTPSAKKFWDQIPNPELDPFGS